MTALSNLRNYKERWEREWVWEDVLRSISKGCLKTSTWRMLQPYVDAKFMTKIVRDVGLRGKDLFIFSTRKLTVL
jgi:hypothetical protein